MDFIIIIIISVHIDWCCSSRSPRPSSPLLTSPPSLLPSKFYTLLTLPWPDRPRLARQDLTSGQRMTGSGAGVRPGAFSSASSQRLRWNPHKPPSWTHWYILNLEHLIDDIEATINVSFSYPMYIPSQPKQKVNLPLASLALIYPPFLSLFISRLFLIL